MSQWDFLWKLIVAVLLVFGVVLPGAGCQKPDSHVTELFKQAAPIVEKGVANLNGRAGAIQGNIQGVNPGYEFDGEAFWGTVARVHGTVRFVGVSGNITAWLQGDNEAQPKPTTRPEGGS